MGGKMNRVIIRATFVSVSGFVAVVGMFLVGRLAMPVVVLKPRQTHGALPKTIVITHGDVAPIITYGGEAWHTPIASIIAPVIEATVLPPNGQVRNSTKVYSFGKWYWEEATGAQDAAVLSDPIISLVQIWSESFQHIIFDTLPKLSFVCPFLERHPDILVLVKCNLQRELVMEACTALYEDRFVIFNGSSLVKAPVVYVPYYQGKNDQALPMGIVPRNSVKSLGSQVTRGTDVVYLARRKGTTRSVANEEEVLMTIRTKWPQLRVVYPTNDWRRDRNAVQNAKVIIAPHGGALSNMIFAPVNATIIEFTTLVEYKQQGKNERPCYFGLACGLGFDYHAVSPSVFNFDSGSMIVPIDRVLDVLRKV